MITQEQLKELLHYDPDTGKFARIKVLSDNNPRAKVGEEAGSIDMYGYRQIGLLGSNYRAHRLAWLYTYGVWPKNQIDHINRVRYDNRIINLRDVTNNQNIRNISNNTSGHVGVSWSKGKHKWGSYITVNRKRLHLGYFEDIEDAVCARKEAEIKYNFYGDQDE